MTIVQRSDEGLNDADRAVESPGVAPRFQIVRSGRVPVAKLSSLILMGSGMNAHPGLLHGRGEVEVGKRVVDWIATKDDKKVDMAGIQIIYEVAQRFDLIDRICLNRFGVDNRLANVPKCRVN